MYNQDHSHQSFRAGYQQQQQQQQQQHQQRWSEHRQDFLGLAPPALVPPNTGRGSQPPQFQGNISHEHNLQSRHINAPPTYHRLSSHRQHLNGLSESSPQFRSCTMRPPAPTQNLRPINYSQRLPAPPTSKHSYVSSFDGATSVQYAPTIDVHNDISPDVPPETFRGTHDIVNTPTRTPSINLCSNESIGYVNQIKPLQCIDANVQVAQVPKNCIAAKKITPRESTPKSMGHSHTHRSIHRTNFAAMSPITMCFTQMLGAGKSNPFIQIQFSLTRFR
jgi:hypothetical protein